MRSLAVSALVFALSACPQSAGPAGPQGAMGTMGTMGVAGTDGVKGDKGDPGEKGDKGDKGDQGDPGMVLIVDGGVVTGPQGPMGPAGAGVVVTVAAASGCDAGGIRVDTPDGGVWFICNGAMGPQGIQGIQGIQGVQGLTGMNGMTGAAGTNGMNGAPGPAPTATQLAAGDVNCPFGGVRFNSGIAVAYACNGMPGPAGSGAPPQWDGGAPPVTFAGFTGMTYTGNLNGRTGAHGLCALAFPSSHFCTDWEWDQAQSGAVPSPSGAWVDYGDSSTTTRYFRATYSTSNTGDCAGWTQSTANGKPDGFNTGRGRIITTLGGIGSSWVATDNGGCQSPRSLACCYGGTSVRFRGYTSGTFTGNLGGRSGANALCATAFAGSHFCTDWQYDQATVSSAPPSSGAWIDYGDSSPSTRYFRATYSTSNTGDCAGWTQASPNGKPDGFNTGRGRIVTPLGGIASSWVATDNGGCQNPRPLSCCE